MQANTKHRRRTYFIEKKFQLHFILKFCTLVVLATLLTGIVLYFFSSHSTTVTFENTRAVVKSTTDFILPILIQTIIVVTIIVGIATIILALFISHRIGGPLYRFKEEMKAIGAGNLKAGFRIRRTDQLQDIALGLNNMVESLRRLHSELKMQYQTLNNSWKRIKEKQLSEDRAKDIEELNKIIESMGRTLDYFKV